jgi:hypothetical protein
MTDRDAIQTWRAELADMDISEIVAFLRERGWSVRRDVLPPGYPPLAGYTPERLPFDSERDGR